jgi:hypothetical protein
MPSGRFSNLPAYTDRSVRKTVCGTEQSFYPISADLLFSLRALAPPLASAFSAFMEGGAGKDQRILERTWGTKDAEEFGSHREVEPVSVEVTAARIKQREKAIQDLIGALLGEDSKALIGQIICDSVRTRTDEQLPTAAEGLEFFRRQNIESLKEYVEAVIEANRGVFGPLVERVSAMRTALGRRIEEALNASGRAGSQKSPSGEAQESSAATDASAPSSTPIGPRLVAST